MSTKQRVTVQIEGEIFDPFDKFRVDQFANLDIADNVVSLNDINDQNTLFSKLNDLSGSHRDDKINMWQS